MVVNAETRRARVRRPDIQLSGFLLAAMLLAFAPLAANALTLDANVVGIFTDSSIATPVSGVIIDPSGDFATASLTAGMAVIIGIDVSNQAADTIQAIFTSLIVQGDQISANLGVLLPPSMLKGPDPDDESLVNINTGGIKMGPSFPGQSGEVWIQAVSYANQNGAFGTGPDTIQILFVLGNVGANEEILFDMTLTAGDAIAGAGSVDFSDALINPIPEPNTALLTGIGLATLVAMRKRS
jgi:hypothetical protein